MNKHDGSHKKKNRILRLASVLFVLVLVSACILAGMLARYTASSEGSDEARVAGFSVNAVNIAESSSMEMDLGTAAPMAVYALKLQNASEAAVNYDVELKFKNGSKLPEGIYVYLAKDQAGAEKIDMTAAQMQAGTEEQIYLIFAPNPDADTGNTIYDVLDDDTDEDASVYTNDIDFEVNVIFTQID